MPDKFVTQLDSSGEFFNFTLIASSLVTVNGGGVGGQENSDRGKAYENIKKKELCKIVPCSKESKIKKIKTAHNVENSPGNVRKI